MKTQSTPKIPRKKHLVKDLPEDRQALLHAFAEGCYDRASKLPEANLALRPVFVANCMQDALDHIGKTESWERIESVVSNT